MSYAFKIGKTINALGFVSENNDYIDEIRRVIDIYLEESRHSSTRFMLSTNKEAMLGDLLLNISINIPITLSFTLKQEYSPLITKDLKLPTFINIDNLISGEAKFYAVLRIRDRKAMLKLLIKAEDLTIKARVNIQKSEFLRTIWALSEGKGPIYSIVRHTFSRLPTFLTN